MHALGSMTNFSAESIKKVCVCHTLPVLSEQGPQQKHPSVSSEVLEANLRQAFVKVLCTLPMFSGTYSRPRVKLYGLRSTGTHNSQSASCEVLEYKLHPSFVQEEEENEEEEKVHTW